MHTKAFPNCTELQLDSELCMFTAQKVCTSITVWVEFCHDYYISLWVTAPPDEAFMQQQSQYAVPPLKNALQYVRNLCYSRVKRGLYMEGFQIWVGKALVKTSQHNGVWQESEWS